MNHPHDYVGSVPVGLDPGELRRLSVISPTRALIAIAFEWIVIAASITAALLADFWLVSLFAIILIGARQHALAVIAHDASHFRLLPGQALNDWVGNMFLAWPVFISVQGFRKFHGDHHRLLNQDGDGNRKLWRTHDDQGKITREWNYPKTKAQLLITLIRRSLFVTGGFWILRGIIGGFIFGGSILAQITRLLLWGVLFWLLTKYDGWMAFLLYWIIPYCTWHILAQYTRLICEHSAVESDDSNFSDTRTTIPGPLGRALILPRNIGYHIEHHWYPSVPFYRLPELHDCLAKSESFRSHANCETSIIRSLQACVSKGHE